MNTTPNFNLDIITFEVIMGSLTAICRHMATSLRRAAYSPIIHDAMDLSAAFIDADLNLIAQQEGCPIHLGTLAYSVRRAIQEYGSSNIEPGDILAVNDPYRGGVHLNDVGFIGPVYWKDELIGYVANRAHWPDIGGMEPSGLAGGSAIRLLHEGLIIPPLKLRHKGILDKDLISFIMANVRGPEERLGDLLAQVAAIDTGVRRMPLLVEKFGIETVRASFRESLAYSKRRMTTAIEQLPEGVYQFEDQMDDDGVNMEPIPMKVTLTVKDSRIKVDFTGTGHEALGPINSPWGMTDSSTLIILKALLDPLGPSNSGWWDLVEIIRPEGTVVNPLSGAPVFGGGIETGLRIYDIIQGALSIAIPTRVTGALYGTIDSSFLSGIDPLSGKDYIYNDWIPGGWGGKYDSDGISCMCELNGNTDDIPIEVAELKYPLRYRKSEFRIDSGGVGKYRGGLGTLREIEVLRGKARASTQADRTKTPPYGIFGGGPGACTRYSLVDNENNVQVLGGRRDDGSYGSAKRNFDVHNGEALRIESAGAGGYGNPRDRNRNLVVQDVLDGYVSMEDAEKKYKIEFSDDELKHINKVLVFQKYG